MATNLRRCSECGRSLADRSLSAKTCSDKCRKDRSRRIKQARDSGNKLPDHLKEVSEIVRGENHEEVLHRVIEDELRPVVRESITQDVMNSINDLVALTPTAIEAIKEDLNSDDKTLRNKAYTLLIKYTIGHRALVTDPDADNAKNLIVNFEMPRPGVDSEPAIPADADELKPCDSCGQDKPLSAFVANSDRCQMCFDEARAGAERLLGGHDAD